MRTACSDLATVLELLMRETIEVALQANKDLSDSLSEPYEVYVLIELSADGGFYLRTNILLQTSQIPNVIDEILLLLKMSFREVPVGIRSRRRRQPAHQYHPATGSTAGPAQDDLFRAEQDTVFALLDRFGSSLSAGGGIGRLKRDAFLRWIDPIFLSLASDLKRMLDPDQLPSEGRILAVDPVGVDAS